MCLAGMSGILLAFGVAGANFTWTDPRRMNAGVTGCLGQALAALFLPVAFGFFIVPLLLVTVLNWPQVYGSLAGPQPVLHCAIAALLPPWLVRTGWKC